MASDQNSNEFNENENLKLKKIYSNRMHENYLFKRFLEFLESKRNNIGDDFESQYKLVKKGFEPLGR